MVNDFFFLFLPTETEFVEFRSKVLLLQMYAHFTVLQSQRPIAVRIEAKRSYHFLVRRQTDRQTTSSSSSSNIILPVASQRVVPR